jgi:hypothetical protein
MDPNIVSKLYPNLIRDNFQGACRARKMSDQLDQEAPSPTHWAGPQDILFSK